MLSGIKADVLIILFFYPFNKIRFIGTTVLVNFKSYTQGSNSPKFNHKWTPKTGLGFNCLSALNWWIKWIAIPLLESEQDSLHTKMILFVWFISPSSSWWLRLGLWLRLINSSPQHTRYSIVKVTNNINNNLASYTINRNVLPNSSVKSCQPLLEMYYGTNAHFLIQTIKAILMKTIISWASL